MSRGAWVFPLFPLFPPAFSFFFPVPTSSRSYVSDQGLCCIMELSHHLPPPPSFFVLRLLFPLPYTKSTGCYEQWLPLPTGSSKTYSSLFFPFLFSSSQYVHTHNESPFSYIRIFLNMYLDNLFFFPPTPRFSPFSSLAPVLHSSQPR